MTGDALAQNRSEIDVTRGNDRGELRAVTSSAASKYQRDHRLLETLGRPADNFVELIVRDPECVGEIAPLEPVAQHQVEHCSVIVTKATGGVPCERRQLARFDGAGRTAVRRWRFGGEVHGVRGKGAGTAAGAGEAFVAGDGEQPGPDTVGLLQLGDAFDRSDEHVLRDVGGVVRVAQQRLAEPVYGTTEPVVQRGESGPVAPGRLACKFTVARKCHAHRGLFEGLIECSSGRS